MVTENTPIGVGDKIKIAVSLLAGIFFAFVNVNCRDIPVYFCF